MEKYFEEIDEMMKDVEFREKMLADDAFFEKDTVLYKCEKKTKKNNSWIRKNAYREKVRREFYYLNPDMIGSEKMLLHKHGIYLTDADRDGRTYSINHVNHLYVTPFGYIEKFRGSVEWIRNGGLFAIGVKERGKSRITNRKIRHLNISEDNEKSYLYSTYKKMFSTIESAII